MWRNRTFELRFSVSDVSIQDSDRTRIDILMLGKKQVKSVSSPRRQQESIHTDIHPSISCTNIQVSGV